MTMPNERYEAIIRTAKFLEDLMDNFELPVEVRKDAYRCLKHFPGEYHLDILSQECPSVIGKKGL